MNWLKCSIITAVKSEDHHSSGKNSIFGISVTNTVGKRNTQSFVN